MPRAKTKRLVFNGLGATGGMFGSFRAAVAGRRSIVHGESCGNSAWEFRAWAGTCITLPALTIALIYKSRWQVELFFKWIKQHLRIKAFFGTSENAVKTQIWIAVSVYVLVAIVRKRKIGRASCRERV